MAGTIFQAPKLQLLCSSTRRCSCRTAHNAVSLGTPTSQRRHISKQQRRFTSTATPLASAPKHASHSPLHGSITCRSSARDSAATSSGRGRRSSSGREEAPPRRFQRPSSRDSNSNSYSPNNRCPKQPPAPSDDFVVIGKADSGTYIQSATDLEAKEGGLFWASAIGEDEYEDDDVSDSEDEELLQGAEEGEAAEMEIEEMTSLLRDLAEGLDDDETESADQAKWRQIYTSRDTPGLYLGPVAVKDIPGKGRGLFATTAVEAGDLIVVAAPLAILYCSEGTTPEIEDLADQVSAAAAAAAAASSSGGSTAAAAAALAPWQQHALLQLRPPGAAAAAAADQEGLVDLLHLLGDPEDVTSGLLGWAAAAGSNGSDQQQQQQVDVPKLPNTAPPALPGHEEILKLVFANCTGEESDDSALVLLRGSHSSGHLGIWPAAALINHSCCPNTHTLLIGDKLVVRAAEDIPAGHELSLSYLGPQLFAPAAVRQQELQQQWGFQCNCNRCKAEARYTGSSSSSSTAPLSDLLTQTYETCQSLSEDLDSAIDNDDTTTIQQIQQQLLDLQQQIEIRIRSVKPPANVRRWIQASIYDLYDLISLCADQLPAAAAAASSSSRSHGGSGQRRDQKSAAAAAAAAVETEALAACARILGAVLPGSSGHVDLATEYMIRAEARFGEVHQEAVDAQRLCTAAHVARYGQCSQGMLQLLTDTRAGAALL